jgi:hypothetical protein
MSVRMKKPAAGLRITTVVGDPKPKTFKRLKRRRVHFVRPVDPLVEELRIMAVDQLALMRTMATALETIATALVSTERGKGVK